MIENLIVAAIFLPYLSFPFVEYFIKKRMSKELFEDKVKYLNETVYVEHAGVKIPFLRSELPMWQAMDRNDKREHANIIKAKLKKGDIHWDGEQYIVTEKGLAKGIKP